MATIEKSAGARPLGWLSPRCTPSTRTSELLAKSGLDWHADFFDSDLPYRHATPAGAITAVPFTMEVNDMPLYVRYGSEPEAFTRILERIVSNWPRLGRPAAGAAAGIAAPAIAQNKPLTIGFSMNLTGPLAPNGKAALLAAQIWEEDINKKGGLLNRPVKLVYYDDQSNPSNIPGLYTKLLDADKVDIIASSYATNMIAPAMPIVMQHDRTFFSLLGLAVNSEFHYPRYFSMTPTGGPKPKESFAEGFFEVAAEQNPKPQTVAMCGADAEFPRNAMDGARQVIKRLGLKLVYDKTYPPNTTDYTPVVRAMAATNPDIFLACSYPADTVGLIRASHEVGFKPKIYGGGMVC